MRRLGDKIAAKQLAAASGVPSRRGAGRGETPDAGGRARRAHRLSAGRQGDARAAAAAASASSRAPRASPTPSRRRAPRRSAAFGDGRLFLERKVSGRPSHRGADRRRPARRGARARLPRLLGAAPPPEGDRGGAAAGSAGARCSPSSRTPPSASRRRSATSGVGTVEFLVADDDYFFLEVNPRLQVEHGVTEAMTGIDLVQLQIRIARGESLALLALREAGCAIEARVCAEDPDAGFLPAPGRIARFDPALGPRVRVDTGVVAGSAVPPAFDSLIAKVIATGDTREEARARLACALRTSTSWSRAAPPTRASCSTCSTSDDYRAAASTPAGSTASSRTAAREPGARARGARRRRRSSPTRRRARPRGSTSSPTRRHRARARAALDGPADRS